MLHRHFKTKLKVQNYEMKWICLVFSLHGKNIVQRPPGD